MRDPDSPRPEVAAGGLTVRVSGLDLFAIPGRFGTSDDPAIDPPPTTGLG